MYRRIMTILVALAILAGVPFTIIGQCSSTAVLIGTEHLPALIIGAIIGAGVVALGNLIGLFMLYK